MTTSAWKGFEVSLTTDVPVLRASTALPLPWEAMVAQFEDKKRDAKSVPNFTVPKSWWIEERGEVEGAVNADKKVILTAENMQGRIKASFVGYRAGIEKQRGDLVAFRAAIEEVQKDGAWAGHRVFLVKDDVEARRAAIKRGQALAAKAKKAKKPAKKAAA